MTDLTLAPSYYASELRSVNRLLGSYPAMGENLSKFRVADKPPGIGLIYRWAEGNPMEETWERGRRVIRETTDLAKDGQEEQALDILDDALTEAIRANRDTWVSILCGHAAILAHHIGDRARQIRYVEKALPFARDYSFAAYNLAQLLLKEGQVVRAEQYAADAYRLSIAGTTTADRDLTTAILSQWPNVAEN